MITVVLQRDEPVLWPEEPVRRRAHLLDVLPQVLWQAWIGVSRWSRHKNPVNAMSRFNRPNGKSSRPEAKTGLQNIPTVKAPTGYPGLTPPDAPKKRGKTPDQYDAELAAYRLAMRKHFAAIAAFRRQRCVAAGITSYKWLALDVHGTCDVAKRNGGKIFSYDNPPKEGHPCEGQCGSPDWCRCSAKPVVPGFG